MADPRPQPRARDRYIRPVVVDKLNNLSQRLAKRPAASRPATWAFGAMARVAPKNDLYHHYRALSLDVLGVKPDEVEREYRQAIAINPLNPWWHSRLVSFLVIRGRLEEAREAWDRAIALLVSPDSAPDLALYRDLHLEVARVLLHRVELEFARTVLDQVPHALRRYLPSYDALRDRLEVLTAAEEYGSFVPEQFLRRDWWRAGPFLLPPTSEGRRLHHWVIGRVEAVSKDVVALQVAEVTAEVLADEGARPRTADTAVSRRSLERRDSGVPMRGVEVGDFVELGFYGDDRAELTTLSAVHDRPVTGPDAPGIFPNPSRYD